MSELADALRAADPRDNPTGAEYLMDDAANRIEDSEKVLKLLVSQWNACGPNSDFGRYFQNIKDAADAVLRVTE